MAESLSANSVVAEMERMGVVTALVVGVVRLLWTGQIITQQHIIYYNSNHEAQHYNEVVIIIQDKNSKTVIVAKS